MLTQLTVKNLAIVTGLDLEFAAGMSVITGETGAGKSILIDALSIALGERASSEQIRAQQTQAEVIAVFDITKLTMVQQLLQQQELPCDECVIRRIINSDGRSRAYINGVSVAVQQLKVLAPYLVQIHSQHQHHALLESDYQRQLLDNYAAHDQLLHRVNTIYKQWAETKQQMQQLTEIQQQSDRLTLLNYQIQELESLNLQTDELQQLNQQHTQLAKAEELLATCDSVNTILNDNQLHSAANQLSAMLKIAPQLNNCVELLQQAQIQVQEASMQLQDYGSKLVLEPQQLEHIERRLSAIHALARKLKVAPEFLAIQQQELCQQRDTLAHATQRLEQLQQQLLSLEQEYQVAAQQLAAGRRQAGKKLAAKIIEKLKTLEMPHASFEISSAPLKHGHPALNGNESINFMVSTNPGQPPGLLRKIASGGELSRISLAIQVICAQQTAIPTLILDEVDVGISGKTAATVGALMRELGAKAQILCITHLPQVAAQGHQHFKVEKLQTLRQTATQITPLNAAQRTQELARLMGGRDITPEALAHARKLMEDASV